MHSSGPKPSSPSSYIQNIVVELVGEPVQVGETYYGVCTDGSFFTLFFVNLVVYLFFLSI